MLNASVVEDLKKRGSIKDSDVLQLRAAFYEDAHIARSEAETLFDINDACPVQDPAWSGFFIEAITDFIVNQEKPAGYVTRANASWLIAQIAEDGKVQSKTELELLVNVIDKARWSPESLCRYVIDQVQAAVVSGSGPLRNGQHLAAGMITDGEVDLIRRALYAFGGDGNIAVTRSEAEALFDISDAIAEETPNAAWGELFSKAITNALMAASGYRGPTREEALRREQWLEERGELSLPNMLQSMVSKGIAGILGSYREQSAEERAIKRLERQRLEIITNEEITMAEAEWLAERIGRDGKLSANEIALLRFLKETSVKLHPVLTPLYARSDIAA